MRNANIKKMAAVALLMALVVVMQFVGGMIPPVGGFSISLVLIPIVLGSALYGPGVGALLGGTFGAIVFINCVTGADPGGAMVFQAGPVLCFLVVMAKGILAGLTSGLVYKLLAKHNAYAAMLCAAIVCPVVNTGVFVVCMLTFFKDVLSVWAGGGDLMAYILTGLVVANFLPEMVINVVFGTAGQTVIHVVNKNK
ncbi:MAG: ECF transporter S component [Ruminococcaceae bacterium]|nr:ECF transporter S component [Oscillospiraceae bacterium]